MRSRCAGVSRATSVFQNDLSPASASSRFSNTVRCSKTRRLLELAADAGLRDLRLGQRQQIDVLAEPGRSRVRPRLAGDDVHHRRLAGAVRTDDAAQLARDRRTASAPSSALKPSKLTVRFSR